MDLGGKAEGGGTACVKAVAVPKGPRILKRRVVSRMPEDIKNNKFLNAAIQANLPSNYNFEIKKTVWKVRDAKASCVALQFPEGLMMFATSISEILRAFAGVKDIVILGDVTYGACCVDDFAAKAAGASFLVS
uniref:2-(3-amino-3-carboxypropyl)histidine synthase n=1 Tax=Palpitomonas bilix TaxID=652834 RepID=A0A7S3GID9_9EUKA|mmetsp:Transcript_50596/g.130447  ORF Transcript_50596/g.130447 Transcript_50596/m.130447 type:complete len:133 (+) Transcript_50596:77-475(+)